MQLKRLHRTLGSEKRKWVFFFFLRLFKVLGLEGLEFQTCKF